MRYLSVCSGIEAASVAWLPLGWTCAGVSEIEPFARTVLQARLGAVAVADDHRFTPGSNILPMFGDFTKIEAHHVGPVDLLVGGTPCQSFSVAGKRLGLDDPRGNLTLEFLALAERLRPKWLLWENVPGVLSDDGRKTLGTFLWIMGQLGYRWAYRVLDAQYVRVAGFGRAVPQRRRRLFVVGYLGDDRSRAVFFDRASMRGDPAPRRRAGEGYTHDVAPCLTSSGVGAARVGENRGQEPVVAVQHPPAVANALTARMTKGVNTTMDEGQTMVPVSRATGFSCRNDGGDALEGISPTLRSMNFGPEGRPNGGGQVAVCFQTRWVRNGRGAPETELCPALNGADAGDTSDMRPIVAGESIDWSVRRLTPRECERLQGFPDDWTLIPYRNKPAKDGPRYRALGNSMAVNVMRWIGTRIAHVDFPDRKGD